MKCRKFLVKLRGTREARVFIYEELARPVFRFLVTSSLIYEELARPAFIFTRNERGQRFFYYEVFTTISAYVELTSAAFFIFKNRRKFLVNLRGNNYVYV